ncbi:M16 family metallopeptidase [Fructobacillus parabroussonetiae]|uniref:Insulinase family protein n=1 Tax=Fructobacillus parabroussonetiae TaxID=2713174 RepID=A0ABS5QWU1_9LACO|nr:insulinase family protein [Fructobacillus parabroussonetiae]MBS9337674.1 insulinase family protein [Fructobacillus parabroussonetiae]
MTSDGKEACQSVLLESQKFNRNTVTLAFVQKAKVGAASKRALLSYLMAVSSKRYPTQQAVAKKLMALYGASFSVRVQAVGDLNLLIVTLTYVKKSRLPIDANAAERFEQEVISFLNDMVFDLDLKGLQEDQQTLSAEKGNLLQAILNRRDDKVGLAVDEARTRLFQEPALQASILGGKEEVKKMTVDQLALAYREMIEEDERLLFVQGDWQEAQLKALVNKWPNGTRASEQPVRVSWPALVKGPLQWIENADFSQAVVLAHYRLPEDRDLFATGLLLNALLGAGPSSLLFTEIREKRSLAYQISSRFQWDLGLVTVLAECANNNARAVLDLVDEQLAKIALGKVEDEMIEQAKRTVLAARKRLADEPEAETFEAMQAALLPGIPAPDALARRIQSVTKGELATLAKELQKIDCSVMGQGEHHDDNAF